MGSAIVRRLRVVARARRCALARFGDQSRAAVRSNRNKAEPGGAGVDLRVRIGAVMMPPTPMIGTSPASARRACRPPRSTARAAARRTGRRLRLRGQASTPSRDSVVLVAITPSMWCLQQQSAIVGSAPSSDRARSSAPAARICRALRQLCLLGFQLRRAARRVRRRPAAGAGFWCSGEEMLTAT